MEHIKAQCEKCGTYFKSDISKIINGYIKCSNTNCNHLTENWDTYPISQLAPNIIKIIK